MPTHPALDRLRSIKSLPQLAAYLRDELDWPIESNDTEEITFDYNPAELGLDEKASVRIKEIKQLRPLAGNQPWGIFFVNFEKKSLPVVVMRQILRALVFKKRASANKADRQAWQPHDLLFISAYGEDTDRAITLAHFVEQAATGLAELRVLGWDDDDTPLHMDYVVRVMKEQLRWDAQLVKDPEAWRARWSKAFVLRHRHIVRTSEELAAALATLARSIRSRIRTILRMEDGFGEMRKLHRAFQKCLIHDLDDDGFADMFAQTVTYGLFSLACRRTVPGEGTAFAKDDLPHYFTSPFLKEMLGIFLGLKSRKGKIDFDQLGVSDVTDLLTSPDTHMEVVLADFNNKTRGEDPVIHFYEHFLEAYNKELKIKRGVFYTPQPVVSYIVRGVHELLQTEFGLEDGLASTITWGEMVKRNPNLKLPPLTDEPGEQRTIDPAEPFVQILDIATGTATFIVEVIDVIHKTMVAKWQKAGKTAAQIQEAWNDYVPKHLLPRVYGFELMMAPYAIAHMKVGLKLSETGYQFATEVPVRIYLTNTLEPKVRQLPNFGFEALAHEAAAVNEIKWYKRFTVIIGNPPYAVTSSNFNPFIDGLMGDYKKHVRGEQGLVALADDYLKFVRLSQKLLAAPNCGVWGMITNHGYLKGVIHRGVRKELLDQFNLMFILDLHGDSNIGERVPEGKGNENVFDIQQGVAVSIGVRPLVRASANAIHHSDLWGSRNEKYNDLASHPILGRKWTDLRPVEPRYFLIPFDDANLAEYEDCPSLNELMAVNSCGVKTHRDGVVIDYDKNTLLTRISDIASERRLELLRERYGITDTPNWKLKDAQLKIKADEVPQFIQRLTYRPFDYRWIYYNPKIIEKGDSKYPTLRHMLRGNVALLSARIQATGVFDAVFVSKFLVEMKTAESSRSCTVFPLFLTNDSESRQAELSNDGLRPNLNPKILFSWAQKLGVKTKGNFELPAGLTPEDIFHYAYAVFHSPGYRSRYAEFLKIDFPRLPLTGNLELFRALARLGGELTALHLLEAPILSTVGDDVRSLKSNPGKESQRLVTSSPTIPKVEFLGGKNPVVEKPTWMPDTERGQPCPRTEPGAQPAADKAVRAPLGTVWLDKAQTTGFKGVREDVWNFHIGGYQVCEKWLKDRKGRNLSAEDRTHYQKIIIALSETIRLMKEVDAVIAKHGGWPGAFAAKS